MPIVRFSDLFILLTVNKYQANVSVLLACLELP